METIKVLKSKVSKRIELNKAKREKRANFDIEQYFEDTQRDYMQAIQVIVIGKDHTYMNRSNVGGRHLQMEETVLTKDQLLYLEELPGYFPDLMAQEYGYVVIELMPPMNGGICPIFYNPNDINDYQIETIQSFADKMKKYNESVDDEFYQFSIDIKDPDTLEGTHDIQSVIDKLQGKKTTR